MNAAYKKVREAICNGEPVSLGDALFVMETEGAKRKRRDDARTPTSHPWRWIILSILLALAIGIWIWR